MRLLSLTEELLLTFHRKQTDKEESFRSVTPAGRQRPALGHWAIWLEEGRCFRLETITQGKIRAVGFWIRGSEDTARYRNDGGLKDGLRFLSDGGNVA